MSLFTKAITYAFALFKKQAQSAHPHQIAVWNNINRRQNFRVNYSHRGPLAGMPRAFWRNEELNVKNISTGGLLVLDDTGVFGAQIGQQFPISIQWPDYTVELNCQVVGAQMLRRHIQFLEFDPIVHKRITKLVPAAYLGSRFRKADLMLESDVVELWVGQADSSLHFLEPRCDCICNLLLEGKTYKFSYEKKWLDFQDAPVAEAILDTILLALANIMNPSTRLKTLIDNTIINSDISLKATGSDNSY